MKPRRLMLRAAALAALLAPVVHGAMTAVPELGLEVADGFRVTVFAGPELVDDIQAMTFDAQGRVVVTGPGYIKTLIDADGDGRAERAVLYAPSRTGGQGLCADGHHLMFVGDGYLSRFTDRDGDGIADGPPEHLLPLHFSEQGGHAIRRGPDGDWLVITGDDARLPPGMINELTSPVLNPSAGVLLRLSRTGGRVEVLAHGLRNPYDFDFDSLGSVFTADADAERDFLLPGYAPPRLFHLALGGHHGWIATGGGRGWSRPEYAPDRIPPLHRLGRGSPTGLEYYRHTQFPREFRDGLFICDWSFGSVDFFPLRAGETSYSSGAEPFLRATGTNGFTPTDISVGPDGSLFVSTGGRRTRGSVYRIEFNNTDRTSPRSSPVSGKLNEILTAPQPLAAWSRARWEPPARELGPEPFRSVVTDEGQPLERRIRALEILTEHFGGLETARARVAIRSKFPWVRARVAWSVGRAPCDDVASILTPLTRDSFSVVRLRALEALLEQHPLIEPPVLLDLIAPALGDRDLRIRQVAARLAARLPESEWRLLIAGLERASPQSRLTGALACLERPPEGAHVATATHHALLVLETLRQEDLLLQALGILISARGDRELAGEPIEARARGAFQAGTTGANADLPRRIREALGAILPSGDWRVNLEATRLLAMLPESPSQPAATVARLAGNEADPTRCFHFLSALARLNGTWDDEQPAQIATALLTLNSTLSEAWVRPRLAWQTHLLEITRRLIQQEPRLARALLEKPNFVSPIHLGLTQTLPPVQRRHAAHLFARAAVGEGFGWSSVLADLVADLPPESSFPYFRKHWNEPAARDAIARVLARAPAEEDRFRFWHALRSTNTAAVSASLHALAALAPSDQMAQIEALFRLLERTQAGGLDSQLASEAATLLSRSIGGDAPAAALRDGPEALLAWCRGRYPSLARTVTPPSHEPGDTARLLAQTPGETVRGEQIFQTLQCAACHSGEHPAVIDLRGVSNRFPDDALLTVLKRPGHGDSRPSRLVRFHARNGQVYEGLLALESAEVVLLRTADGHTARLRGEDLIPGDPAGRILSPGTLVESLSPAALRDLLSYLRSL